MVLFFVILALVFVVLLVIITNIVIVPQSKVYVIERLGSYSDTWSAGLLLTSMMSECAKSFERLPILLHADILRNILYSGVWSKYEYLQIKKRRIEEKAKKKEHKQ